MGRAKKVAPAGLDSIRVMPPLDAELRAIATDLRLRLQRRAAIGDPQARPQAGAMGLFVDRRGSGKTLAAEAIAEHLGRDLLQVDLAAVMSRSIDEIEKNLERLFAAAERADVVLFFDEADALFGQRTQVGDAHDRYADSDVSCLLRRLESFGGVVIFGSRHRERTADAFAKRLDFVVDIPAPPAT